MKAVIKIQDHKSLNNRINHNNEIYCKLILNMSVAFAILGDIKRTQLKCLIPNTKNIKNNGLLQKIFIHLNEPPFYRMKMQGREEIRIPKFQVVILIILFIIIDWLNPEVTPFL